MSCRRVGSDILRDPSAHEESHVGGTSLLLSADVTEFPWMEDLSGLRMQTTDNTLQ